MLHESFQLEVGLDRLKRDLEITRYGPPTTDYGSILPLWSSSCYFFSVLNLL